MQSEDPNQEHTYQEYVTVGDAAVLLGVSIDTIRRWEKTGKLRAERLDGKNRYFSVPELERFKSMQPLSTTEVAVLLGVSPSTVRRLEEMGELMTVRDTTGRRLFDKGGVEAYVKRLSEPKVSDDGSERIQVRREEPISAAETSPLPSVSLSSPVGSVSSVPAPSNLSLTAPGSSRVLPDYSAAQTQYQPAAASPTLNAPRPSGGVNPSGQPGFHIDPAFLIQLQGIFRSLRQNSWARLGLFVGAGFTGVVSVFVLLFMLFPTSMARVMGYQPGVPSSRQYVTPKDPSLFAKATRPFSVPALGVVEVINPELRVRIKPHDSIKNVNDVFGPDAEGNISAKYPFTVPDSSYIKLPDNGLISNLNAEYINGRKPGEGSGNLAVVPLNGRLIKDNSITGVQIADGSIQLSDLAPSLLSSLRGGSGGSGATGTTGPAGPQGLQGPVGPQGPAGSGGSSAGDIEGVTAGSGLQGGGTSGTVTLSVSVGDTIEVVNGDLEVKLAVSGSTSITSSNSGLERTNQGLRLIGGCAAGQLLKWNGSAWACASDLGGSGSGAINVQASDGSTVVSGVSNLQFGPGINSTNEFVVTSIGGGQARVTLGSNVLQSGNYTTVLDPTYVNVNESPATGDIGGSFSTGLTIMADAVALGTDTTGSYVSGINGSAGVVITGSGSENASVGIALDITTTGVTGTSSGNSGLEIGADGLRLLGGCSANQILKWNGSVWACSADNAGSGALDIKEGGTTVTASASALNLTAADFSVVNFSGQADVSIDYANSGITRRTATEVVTGNWTFTDNAFSIQDNADSTKKVALELAALTGGVTRTLNVPNVNGTLITSGNLADITTVGTITSGVWQGSTLSVQYGGTGATSFTTNGIVYGNGTGALQSTAAGTSGQLVVAGATGIPSFVSMAGDASIAANGVLTLSGSGVVNGTYGSSTQVPVVTVDGKGRITSVVNTTISGVPPGGNASGDLSGTYPGPTVVRINGVSLGDTSASAGHLLVASGTSWVSRAISGDLTVSSTGVVAIGADAVTLGTDTTGNYVAALGMLTGLSVSNNSGEGSTPALSVLYGSTANTAAAGNTQITCASGTGNLAGGGNTLTLGAGGSCNSINTISNPSFSTSVATPLVTNNGSLTIQTQATAGADDLILQVGGTERVRLLENGDFFFERGTFDATLVIATPVGAAATYTLSGASGTILTSANYSGTLDSIYVNASESPAAGDITGSFAGGLIIGADAVALGLDTTGNYIAALGVLTGLTTTGNTGEGSAPTLSVTYGSTANTAVQGNTGITVSAGTNLAGGGTLTLGAGGTLTLNTVSNPSFTTSITTPLLQNSGVLSLTTTATAASDDIVLSAASSEIVRFLEGGDVRFEKGTNDVTFAIATPSGAPATYTFSGVSGTVLTTGNYAANLDSVYVNTSEAPAAGDISGSFQAGFTVNANSVALGTDTTGDYLGSLGALTGLSTTGNTGEGSTPTLAVLYGSTANTAVQGNTTLTCASGTGNLSGGGNTITMGTGGSCNAISTNNAVSFSTSVTTPLLTNAGALTVSTTGVGNNLLLVAGGNVRLSANGSTLNCSTFDNGGVLTTDALGNIVCQNDDGGAAGTITGSGTANRIPFYTGTGSLGNSWLNQNISTLEIDSTRNLSLLGGNLSVTGTGLFTGLITANGGLTIEIGDIFTVNGDAFTDLTGTGLIISGGALQTTLGTSVNLTTEVDGILPVANGGTGANSLNDLITLGAHTTGNYVATLGALTGLSTTGNTGEGSTPTLAVLYGSTANTAVQGNTTLTCASGTGNLSGGGNTITMGTGGSCNAISTNNDVSFTTAVRSPLFTNAGSMTISTTGIGNNLSLISGSGSVLLGANTLQRSGAGGMSIDLSDAGNTTLNISNSGVGTASLNIVGGSIQTAGTTRITNAGALQNVTASTDILTSGTLGTGRGGTGATSFTANGVLFGGGSGALQVTVAGTGGQLLIANISGVPTFTTLGGDATLSSAGVLTLANSGVTANTYGSSTEVPVFTVDGKGRITGVTNTTITGASPTGVAGGDLTGNFPNPTIARLQGATLTTGTLAGGNMLMYNGSAWVNQSISGDVTVSSTGVATIANNAVTTLKILDGNVTTAKIADANITNAKLANSSLTVSAGTGLSGGGTVSLGGSTSLAVAYGSLAGTAVQGNTALTCASGTGNLSGGGNTITMGTGGSCNAISTNNAVSFSTSVTTPLLTTAGPLMIQTQATIGSDDIVFQTAGTEKMRLLENGDLFFEKGVNDVTFAIATPGAPATYAFSGVSGTVLTTGNYAGTMDSVYVNVGESPAAGDITGSFGAGLNIGAGTVTNAKLQNSSFATSFGTNLSGSASVALGGTLSVSLSATPSFTSVTATTFTGALSGNATTATALAADPTDCAVNTFATTIAANGNLTCSTVSKTALGNTGTLGFVWSDAEISDTLTASVFRGTGSLTDAVDLATAEIAGILPVANGGTGANSLNDLITLGAHTTGNYVATLGALTGLSTTGNTGEGSTPTLAVLYGSTANTAVQGNTTLTCASGTGNLSGGGNTITMGTGGSCNAISTNNAVSFSTSVTTPVLTTSGALVLQTQATVGSDDIIFQTAGTEKIRILENGNFFFEKGVNDATIAVAAPSGADATYTFSGVSGTVLTTGNYSGTLDAAYVNIAEAPAAGDISGSFSAGLTVNSGAITNAKLQNSSIGVTLGSNLSGSTTVSLGGTLSVGISATPSFTSVTATTFTGALAGNASTATALAANPTDCSANQFANAIAANGNLTCAAITDADVSDTLTASIFIGSGSTTNAVDLATAEIAGNLRATNLQSAAADLGAANVNIDLSNSNAGGFVTNLTVDGTITAATFSGSLSGNATTATALAANPTDCAVNQFATAIAANGNLTCLSITDADVPDNITVTNATNATNLIGAGSTTNAVDLATAEVSGNLRATNLQGAPADLGGANINIDLSNSNVGGFVTNLTVDGTITAATFVGALNGNASTATALAANPTDCAVNTFATTIAANGNLTCAAITDADVPNNITIDLATNATNATNLVGTGSTTNAVDLATAEVAGNLRAINLQSAGADLGAANVNVDLSNTNGAFVTNLTVDGTITAATFSGSLSGNATTATALAANPTDCAVNTFANAIAANGNLSCVGITDADVSDTLTASIFIGSGSTTNAVDLATAEVAGSLRATNLQNAAADLGAANVNVDLSNTNGAFVTNLTVDGSVNSGSVAVNATGVGSGTLNGVGISGITPGAGVETALRIGRGWDTAIGIDPSVTGTIISASYATAATQTGSLVGASFDFNTNFTGSQGRSITGVDVAFPGMAVTGSVTNYTGFNIGSATNLSATAGTINWNGASFTLPNIDANGGTITSNGLRVITGTITNGGTMNGLNVIAQGVTHGTLNGLNIGAITAGAGAETGIKIGTGWDTGIDLSAAMGTSAISLGSNTITGTGASINFSKFSVSGSTGSVTIDDTGNAGALLVEGTRLDIDSLDFVGAGIITTASGNLTLDSASNILVLGDATVQRTALGTTTLDLNDSGATLLALTNSGVGVASLSVEGGGTFGAAITVSAGGASITGGLNNNSGGITNAGAISGATSVTSSGNITISNTSVYQQNGLSGISLTCGGGQVYVGGGVRVSGGIITNGSCTNDGLSDQRLKKDVSTAKEFTLQQINKVNTINFNFDCAADYFSGTNTYCDTEYQAGVLAQELMQIFPELVRQNEDGYYEVNYQGLNIYTLKAVQELSGMVDELMALKGQVNDLEGRVASLETSSSSGVTNENGEPVYIEDLTVGRMTVNMDLFTRGALTVAGSANFQADAFFQELVTFGNSVTFTRDVQFQDTVSFNSNTGGYALINPGQQTVRVAFTKPYTVAPIISVSLADGKFVQYSYKNVTADGFDIVLNIPAAEQLQFSWIALSITNPDTVSQP